MAGKEQEKLCDTEWFCYWFAQALKHLLENKHLYQLVNIRSFYETTSPNATKYDWSDMAKLNVGFDDEADPRFRVVLPTTLNLVCANRNCEEALHPHNLALCKVENFGHRSGASYLASTRTLNNGYHCYFTLEDPRSVVQQFSVQYQCQSCKGEPLTFMIRREGLKLQIVGRSRIEPCVMPEGVPSEMMALLSDAMCASQTGSVLAGICLMRIAIEQYVRIKAQDMNGRDLEVIFGIYKTTLPQEFPSQCVGLLRSAYDRLSEAIHAAKSDSECFEASMQDITKHFKMLAAFNFVRR